MHNRKREVAQVPSGSIERGERVKVIPLSAIRQNGQKINYFEFISELKQPDCNAALRRIAPRIQTSELRTLVDQTPFLTELQREFYFTMLPERKERILDFSPQKLQKRERKKKPRRQIIANSTQAVQEYVMSVSNVIILLSCFDI